MLQYFPYSLYYNVYVLNLGFPVGNRGFVALVRMRENRLTLCP